MQGIVKFERDYLDGESIHVRLSVDDMNYKMHWHNYYEITAYFDCNGICSLNDIEYPITGNCLFLLTPKDFHKIACDYSPKANSIIIAFSEQVVEKYNLASVCSKASVMYNIGRSTEEKMREMLMIFGRHEPNYEQYLKLLLNLILLDIGKEGQALPQHSSEIHPAVEYAIDKIISNPSLDLSAWEIASSHSITPEYFSHIFKKQTGRTFKKYLNDIKVTYAKRLLEESELSILDISLECGYNTPSHFNKVFKAYTGVAPYAYRKTRKIKK